jgi:hypothetical protein
MLSKNISTTEQMKKSDYLIEEISLSLGCVKKNIKMAIDSKKRNISPLDGSNVGRSVKDKMTTSFLLRLEFRDQFQNVQ